MFNNAFKLLGAVLMLAILASGCTMLEQIPNPQEVLKEPLGKVTLRPGMSKAEVEYKWGKPDDIQMVENPKRWPLPRQMWVYRAQTDLPIDADYLSKTRRLYFDGDYLTDIE